jgi:uncharacterized protein (DUF1778 family)
MITTKETIHLQDADWDVFYAALTNPPEPNYALKNLLKDICLETIRRAAGQQAGEAQG